MFRKKILWISSWYPNKEDKFDGDFIQRQAQAASLFHDIYVIFLKADKTVKKPIQILNRQDGLEEQIVYYPDKKSIFKHISWFRIYIKTIKDFIQTNGRPDLIHVQIPWKAGLIALYLKYKYRLPYIISEHWGMYNDNEKYSFNQMNFVYKALIRKLYHNAVKLILVSQYLKKLIENSIGFTKPSVIIPNVVNIDLFHLQNEKHAEFTFIHVSNMAAVKNAPSILRAFKLFTNEQILPCRLLMVGNKDDALKIYAKEIDLNEPLVTFTGEISYQLVAEKIRKCHAFIILSSSETFSCVTAEALCAGLPVIASAKGALPELINNSNGIILQEANEMELLNAMKEMVKKYDRFQKHQISVRASALYSYQTVAKLFDQLYTEICSL